MHNLSPLSKRIMQISRIDYIQLYKNPYDIPHFLEGAKVFSKQALYLYPLSD